MGLTEQQQEAARLIAVNKLTLADVALKVGVSARTLQNWRQSPEFNGQVREIAEAWRERARNSGVADRDMRLRYLNDRHRRLCALIEARAKDPGMATVPGGKTGLLTVTYKMLTRMEDVGDGKKSNMVRITEPVPEYAVDTGLLAEMRHIEDQAAIEMGQRRKTPDEPPAETTVNITNIQATALARVMTTAELTELKERLDKLPA